MSASSALVIARARALTRMVDSGTITRTVAGTTVMDPATGARPKPEVTPIYSGPCFLTEKRIQNPGATGVADDFPVEEVASLVLPSLGPRIERGDIFVLTAAPDHPQDVGRRFRIISFNPGTQNKARQFQMSAIIG